jgi:myo-inositol-1(or 4)-monophosphatase
MTKTGLADRELRRLLRATSAVAVEAGSLLKKSASKERSVRYKGRVDLVTEMDVKSERLIVSRLRHELPGASFLAEEGSAVESASEFKWIIDPLDGTTNYAHGFPVWCVSIALESAGEMALGCVFDPTRDELFTAITGAQAKLNGKPISVSRQTRLDQSLLATGFPYDIRTSKVNNLVHFADFARTAQGIRRAGSAALDICYLAMGRFDGFWELKLHPWDSAAATLIVRQAGGKVSDFAGQPYSIYGDTLLATNGKIHRQMMKVLEQNLTTS